MLSFLLSGTQKLAAYFKNAKSNYAHIAAVRGIARLIGCQMYGPSMRDAFSYKPGMLHGINAQDIYRKGC